MARILVFGNEKGGAGKSTLAIHVASYALNAGERVAILDLDLRQLSFARFFENRLAWAQGHGKSLKMAHSLSPQDHGIGAVEMPPELRKARFEALLQSAQASYDLILIDTPGSDTELSRLAHQFADLIITPMNDSFVDFDLLGKIDAVNLDLIRPSFYAETVWEARKQRALREGGRIDWVVVRNRLAPTHARNRNRVDERLIALSKRIGFRVAAGLRDRVIYRELFPFGVSVLDLSSDIKPLPTSLAQISARQELRAVMAELAAVSPEIKAKVTPSRKSA